LRAIVYVDSHNYISTMLLDLLDQCKKLNKGNKSFIYSTTMVADKFIRWSAECANRRVINRFYKSAKSHWQQSKDEFRDVDTHRCLERRYRTDREKVPYIHSYMEEIGEAIERNSCIDAVVHPFMIV